MADVKIISIPKEELLEELRSLIREELSLHKTENDQRPDEIFNRKDAAYLLKVSLPFLQKITEQGIIPSFKAGRVIRYRKSELLKAIGNGSIKKYQRSNSI